MVLDTNILVSALIAPAGNPAAIYNAWEQGKFTVPWPSTWLVPKSLKKLTSFGPER